jgi:ATP-dependent Clp protease protease subunit
MSKQRPVNTKNKVISRADKYDNTKFYIEYGIDIDSRKVMLDEDVDEYSVGWIIRGIEKMLEIDNEKEINITINSYGGYVYDGLALYDFIESLPVNVKTHGTGKIMSCGLIIFLAGDERTCSKRAKFMAHSISGGIAGKLYEMKIDTKETEELHKELLQILADKTNKTYAWWKKEIEYKDRYYNQEQAKKLAIID